MRIAYFSWHVSHDCSSRNPDRARDKILAHSTPFGCDMHDSVG